MFKTLYCCPRTIARHENGHLYESRCAYLEHLAAQGSSRKTLRVAAEVIYRAAVYLRLDSSSPVERSDVERAAKDWATRPYGNGNQIGPERVIKRFRLIVCGWLRFAVVCMNQIAHLVHTKARSMPIVATWKRNAVFRQPPSGQRDTISSTSSARPGNDDSRSTPSPT